MSTCPHCGYSDPAAWADCPACGQPQPTPAANPPVDQTPPPVGYGGASYAPPSPGGGAYPSPGQNPYAPPTSPNAPPASYAYAYSQPAMLPTSGKAVTSMVLGICSIVIPYIGVILGPIAIAFWAAASGDFRHSPPIYKGTGFSTAGLICGIIGTVIWVLVFVMIFVIVSSVNSASRHDGF